MIWHIIDLLSFVLVALITGLLIPRVLFHSFNRKLFDIPNRRKVHTQPVPRLGGIVFLPAILLSVFLVCCVGTLTDASWLEAAINSHSVSEAVSLGCGIMLLYIVGLLDDLNGIHYIVKFIVQIGVAFLMVAGGFLLSDLHGLFGIDGIGYLPAVLLTVFLIVLITNAINLIDGIDGLSSGIGVIATAIYGYVLLDNGVYLMSLISFGTCGALVSFFCFNVFGSAERHMKIFMGDAGTLTVGVILSALSIQISSVRISGDGYDLTVVAFAPLLVPCFDAVRVSLYRLLNHANPFLPDRNHIHHRIMKAGFGAHNTMVIILGLSVVLSFANILLSSHVGMTYLLCGDIIIWIVFNMIINKKVMLKNNRQNKVVPSLRGQSGVESLQRFRDSNDRRAR